MIPGRLFQTESFFVRYARPLHKAGDPVDAMAVHLYPVDTSKGPDARVRSIRGRAEGAQQGRHRQAAVGHRGQLRRPPAGPPTVVPDSATSVTYVGARIRIRPRSGSRGPTGTGGTWGCSASTRQTLRGSRPPVVRSSLCATGSPMPGPRDARTPTGCGAAPLWARTAQLSLWSGRRRHCHGGCRATRGLPAGRQLCRGDHGSDAGCATGSAAGGVRRGQA